jgi:hypothetical protein
LKYFSAIFSHSKTNCYENSLPCPVCHPIFDLIFSQTKANLKFGEISAADFNLPNTEIIDSNTNAVIIADIGSTTFIGNKKGWFTLVFKRSTRIKILNEKAFRVATVHIPLYSKDDNQEKLEDVKAATYNLENGKVVSTKLGKNDLFQEKLDKNHFDNKFTMPAIADRSLSIVIPSIQIFYFPTGHGFQHVNYPCLWSEFGTVIQLFFSM